MAEPSFVEGLKALVMAPLERKVAERDTSRIHRRQAQHILDRFEETARRVVDDDNEGWIAIGQTGRDLDEAERTALRNRARKAVLQDPIMVGYLRSMQRFVMGEGPTFSAADEDERLNERVDDWWGTFKKVNEWDSLEDEIPTRTWRDGEAFVRYFRQEMTGPPQGWEPSGDVARRLNQAGMSVRDLRPEVEIPEGMIHVRFVDPEHVGDPKGHAPEGIITSGSDVQTVLGYMITGGDKLKVREVVPAKDMDHIKIRTDQNQLRGRSLLEPLLKRHKQYNDWLEYRIMLNLARTALVLVKKMDGATAADISNVRDNQRAERNRINDRRQKAFKPMSTIHSSGIDYEFLSPNLQASDAQKDGRRILLDMAAGAGIAEFMFTGNSQNANYASSLAAETPTMREFESWRDFFEPHFERIWRRNLRSGAKAGQIEGVAPERVDDIPLNIVWPSVEVRDELDHTKSQQIRHGAGILSRQTWQEDAGLDPEAEERRMEEERERAFEFTPPPEPMPDESEGDE